MNRAAPKHTHGSLTSAQLSSATWPDFEKLFASNGGVWGGCWCMFFHESGSFDSRAYARNKEAKRKLTVGGKAHGTIVYCGGEPVGWCQYGPKDELPRIDRKKGYTPTSQNPWRITCLFIAPGHRKIGLSRFAVHESLVAMKKLKAEVVEAYPVDSAKSATFLWMGTSRLFEGEGFTRVAPLGKASWVYSLRLRKR